MFRAVASVVFAIVVAASCAPGAKANSTYSVDIADGSDSLVGTITTDGNAGPLSLTDIVDWNLTMSNPSNYTSVNFLGPLSGSNSVLYQDVPPTYDLLSASPTGLFYNDIPSGGTTNFWSFGEGVSFFGIISYGDDEFLAPALDGVGDYIAQYPISNGQQFAAICSITAVCATTPPTPLPAALPLFAAGLGALGLFGWRRKRKNTANIAAA